MIEVKCYKCKVSLERPGGLIISPPKTRVVKGEYREIIYKMHLCRECYSKLIEVLDD